MINIVHFIGCHNKLGFFKIIPNSDDLKNLDNGPLIRSFEGDLVQSNYCSNFFKRKIKSGKTFFY